MGIKKSSLYILVMLIMSISVLSATPYYNQDYRSKINLSNVNYLSASFICLSGLCISDWQVLNETSKLNSVNNSLNTLILRTNSLNTSIIAVNVSLSNYYLNTNPKNFINSSGVINISSVTWNGGISNTTWSNNQSFLSPNLTGATGSQGVQGVAGTNGTNGINGNNGTNGVNGSQGIAGTNGTNGANGINGTNGVDGINGTDINSTNFYNKTETDNKYYNISNPLIFINSTYGNVTYYPLNTNPSGYLTSATANLTNYYNKSEIDTSLNLKLNISDQRYNDTGLITTQTGRIDTLNSTLINTNTGVTNINSTLNELVLNNQSTILSLNNINNTLNNDVSNLATNYTKTINLPVYNNLTLAQIVLSIGNWSADKSLYTLLTATQNINTTVNTLVLNNQSTILSLNNINTTVNNLLSSNTSTNLRIDNTNTALTNTNTSLNNEITGRTNNETQIRTSITNINTTVNNLVTSNTSTNGRIDTINNTLINTNTALNNTNNTLNTQINRIDSLNSTVQTDITNLATNYYNTTTSDSRYLNAFLRLYFNNTNSTFNNSYTIMQQTQVPTLSIGFAGTLSVGENQIASRIYTQNALTTLEAGSYMQHTSINITNSPTVGRVLRIHSELYIRNASGVERLIGTSVPSDPLILTNGLWQDIDFTGTVTTKQTLATGEYLVMRLNATVSGSGGTLPAIQLITGGQTGASLRFGVDPGDIAVANETDPVWIADKVNYYNKTADYSNDSLSWYSISNPLNFLNLTTAQGFNYSLRVSALESSNTSTNSRIDTTNTALTNTNSTVNALVTSNTSTNNRITAVNNSLVNYGGLALNNAWTGNNVFTPSTNTTFNNDALFYGATYFFNNVTLTNSNTMSVNGSINIKNIGGTIIGSWNDVNGLANFNTNGNITGANLFGNLNWSYLLNVPSFALDSRVTTVNNSLTNTNTALSNTNATVNTLLSSNTSTNNRIDTTNTALTNTNSTVNALVTNNITQTGRIDALNTSKQNTFTITNDTNIGATLNGVLTFGWIGTLADARISSATKWNNLNNLTLAQIVASIGNFTGDKSLYTLLTQTQDINSTVNALVLNNNTLFTALINTNNTVNSHSTSISGIQTNITTINTGVTNINTTVNSLVTNNQTLFTALTNTNTTANNALPKNLGSVSNVTIIGNVYMINTTIKMCSAYSGVPCYTMYVNSSLWNCRNSTYNGELQKRNASSSLVCA